MRILALIPARGGSKRIPRKNIRPFAGRPLITWTIEAAKGASAISDVLVSTDDDEIAAVARRAGALVPWLRPASLATDTASSQDVALHALDWYEAAHGAVDGLLLLAPTSPLRSADTLARGCTLFEANRSPVIGVSPAKSHPMWCFRIDNGKMRPFVDGVDPHARSQDLPPAFVDNGAFYLVAPADLRRRQSFYSDDMVPLIVDNPDEHADIDTEQDWVVAEQALRRRLRRADRA